MSKTMVSPPKPTVGRIVHFYMAANLKPIAALITAVNDNGKIDLALFPPRRTSLIYAFDIQFSETPLENSWTWPPREG